MDPHQQWLHYQKLLDEQRLRKRLLTAFNRIRRHVPDDKSSDEQLRDVSPSRSSRIAEYVRTHKGAFIGGTAAAFVIAVCGEVIRRTNNK